MALILTGRGRGGGRGRRFAAVANPHGVHVVEYRRGRAGLEVVAGARRDGPGADPGRVVAAVAEAVESLGGRGRTLELAVSGFGSAHHILALPAAAPEILQPVVRRELLRYYPDLKDPVIGFTVGPRVEGSEGPRRELLVGAVPRAFGEALHRGLLARRVTLTHLTVLPQAFQAAFTAFDGRSAPTVTVLLLDGGALIGCFEESALRLYIEPPPDIHGHTLRGGRALAEQVSRATLFLRQQFPGSGPARVLAAGTEAEDGELEALDAAVDEPVERFGALPAGPLVAVGAALDAGSERPLQLLPSALRPRRPAEAWTRRIAAAAAAVLVGASLWWAGSAIMVARAEAAAAGEAEARVSSRIPWLTGASRLLDERRAHAERVAFLERAVAGREDVGRILEAVAAVAPPSVRLEAAHLHRDEDGAWRLLLAGVSRARTGAAAVQAVDGLYRGLPRRLPVTEVELGELESARDEDGAVALAFDMSFIVRWEQDLRR